MDYGELVSPLMEFFNQGADKQLGSRKRDSEGNIKMTKWDYVTGRSQDELNNAARKRLLDSDDAQRYTTLTDGDVVPENMRSAELRRDLKRLTDLDSATKIYLATSNNSGRSALEGLRTDAEVYQKINELNKSNSDAEAREPGGRIDMLNRNQEQLNLTNQLALNQMALSEQRASNQMQIAMMDNQLERRRMDMKESRLDRRDRQAMIQQMMAGLSTLGASIAI